MPPQNDDRPKKSWREIDQAREHGGARREPNRSQARPNSQAYRSYKTQLGKLFDGGIVPPTIAQSLGTTTSGGGQSNQRATAAKAIVEAAAPKALQAALHAYNESFGFPQDEPVLLKLLDSSDEAVVGQAVAGLAALQGRGALKRAAATKARLKTVEVTHDHRELRAAAKALAAKL